jgi:hypothetical protein
MCSSSLLAFREDKGRWELALEGGGRIRIKPAVRARPPAAVEHSQVPPIFSRLCVAHLRGRPARVIAKTGGVRRGQNMEVLAVAPGTRVLVKGLVACTRHNGLVGVVSRAAAAGRYEVHLCGEDGRETAELPPANMQILTSTASEPDAHLAPD